MRLFEAGEFGLLRELERLGLVSGQDAEGALLGDGRVATADVLAEGIHFRLDWTSFRDLGYKAAAVNLSDLAAMGAAVEGLLVGLGAPAHAEVAEVVELYEGLNETGVPVVGGDTTRTPFWFLSVTAFGTSERVPGRAGARPGDVLVVTGPLGGSAAGRQVLEHGLEGFDELVEAHRRPPLRLEEGRALARVAHALVDLSDGIGSDAARIAERSGCKIVLDVDAIPRAARIEEVADLPFWTMGEDYELLAVLAPEDADASGFTVVGRVEEGSGVEPALQGWDSFRG
ncbi:MAG TPA: thiamine-phosphate kinase [Gaiellaceae bacterium]|nr:thiamine-phosphate kinase [Gaiellaceae bacterium]